MANLDTDISGYIHHVRTSANADLLAGETLTISREGHLTVHWAPFEHVAPNARLAIVGITPGRAQATNALLAFKKALQESKPHAAALRDAKLAASFSGPMRSNLVRMLDRISLPKLLAVPGAAALFDPMHERVHFTSALRYPVFVDGANYNGNPDPLRSLLLRGMVETCLAAEVRALPHAVWLPLGPKPTACLQHLVSLGVLAADRVLVGLPHPSGANAERIAFFLGLKPRLELSARTRPDQIEQDRDRLLAQVSRLAVV